MDWFKGKIAGTPQTIFGKSMVSCRFSQPIHGVLHQGPMSPELSRLRHLISSRRAARWSWPRIQWWLRIEHETTMVTSWWPWGFHGIPHDLRNQMIKDRTASHVCHCFFTSWRLGSTRKGATSLFRWDSLANAPELRMLIAMVKHDHARTAIMAHSWFDGMMMTLVNAGLDLCDEPTYQIYSLNIMNDDGTIMVDK